MVSNTKACNFHASEAMHSLSNCAYTTVPLKFSNPSSITAQAFEGPTHPMVTTGKSKPIFILSNLYLYCLFLYWFSTPLHRPDELVLVFCETRQWSFQAQEESEQHVQACQTGPHAHHSALPTRAVSIRSFINYCTCTPCERQTCRHFSENCSSQYLFTVNTK